MTNIIEIKKISDDKKEKLRQELLDGLKAIPENVTSALIAFRTDDGIVHTGFFNSSLEDEAVMLKVLDIDSIGRQLARDDRGDGGPNE